MKNILLITLLLNSLWSFGQTETNIVIDSLPFQVKENLAKKYHGYSVAKVIKAIDKSGTISYKLEARKAKSSNETTIYDLVYDGHGKLKSKKKDKEIFYSDSPQKRQSTPHQSGDGHKH